MSDEKIKSGSYYFSSYRLSLIPRSQLVEVKGSGELGLNRQFSLYGTLQQDKAMQSLVLIG